MKKYILFLLAFFVYSLLLSSSDGLAQSTDKVVAEVSGRKITQSELTKALGPDLYEMQKRVYLLKQNKLDELIGKILLEKEAAKKKMTVPKLLDKYVQRKVKKVRKKDIEKFYKENQSHLKGTKEQFEDRIRNFLGQENYHKAFQKYMGRLKRRAKAKIHLEKPQRLRIKLSLTDGPQHGKKNAKVEVVEFSDFECPYCSRLTNTMEKIYRKYRRKVSFRFKAFPLAKHTAAPLAHQASLCADDQKKFWPFHKLVFKNQSKMQRSDLENHAKSLRLDMTQFRQCLDSGEKVAKVQKEVAEGEEAGVRSTPTLFINGQMVVGAVPQAEIEEIINAELKRKN